MPRLDHMKIKILYLLIAGVLCLGCHETKFKEQGSVSEEKNQDKSENPPDEVVSEAEQTAKPPSLDESLLEQVGIVEEKCQSKELKHKTTKLIFPKDDYCSWGKKDNLARRNGFVTARKEQFRSLDIPKDAHICSLELDAGGKEFEYDDEIILAFNGVVLLASKDYSDAETFKNNQLQKVSDLIIYDWKMIVGSTYDRKVGKEYCLAESQSLGSCQIPSSEKRGTLGFTIDKSLVMKVAALVGLVKNPLINADPILSSLPKEVQNGVTLITTGDDNAKALDGGDRDDCTHNDYSFNAIVSFVE